MTKSNYYKNLYSTLEGLDKKTLLSEIIPKPNFCEGNILYDILKTTSKAMNDEIAKYSLSSAEYREYIELWVHEIKTPISGAKLICENSGNRAMLDSLHKIEKFVEQTLFYSRSSAVEKDFLVNVVEELRRLEIPVESYASEIVEFKIYNSGIALHLADTYGCDFMKLSDCNRLLEMQGKGPVILADNEFTLNCLDDVLAESWFSHLDINKITIGGKEMTLKNVDDTALYNAMAKTAYGITLIVPDELVENHEIRTNAVAVNYIDSTKEYENLFQEACKQLWENLREQTDKAMNLEFWTHCSSQIGNFEQNTSISLTITYLAVYLGIVFLIISAVVLAITQLSEASDNIARYELLRKLGTDGSMINKALFTQIAVYFVVPLMLAVIHSVIGIKVASNVIFIIGQRNILRDSIFAAAVILVIYGGYFLATYFGSKRIVSK